MNSSRSTALKSSHTISATNSLNVIHVKEENSLQGKEPIEWFLVTGEAVSTAEEACEFVGDYMQRWKIERFHYVQESVHDSDHQT